MTTEQFYAQLSPLTRFIDITQPDHFQPVPEDWYVVVTDVVSSTKNIAQGRYKAVNFVGAMGIVSVLNGAGAVDIPYVFGGDGASLLVPPSLVPTTQAALLAIQAAARRDFQLDLRVALIPVSHVTAYHRLLVAKVQVSSNYSQAAFRGGGLTYATQLMKAPATQDLYQPQISGPPPQADLSGLECRWQSIPSRHGDMVTLMVQATAPSDSQMNRIYADVIGFMGTLYGTERDQHRPITPDQLKLSFAPRTLRYEVTARGGRGWLGRWLYLGKIWMQNLMGLVMMGLGVRTPNVDWGHHREDVVSASDYRKFDDLLRMVIASSPAHTRRLARYLEARYQEGRLVYGLHVSSSALMTCLVFERSGQQVHFVDGSDGGYALAALDMKRRLSA